MAGSNGVIEEEAAPVAVTEPLVEPRVVLLGVGTTLFLIAVVSEVPAVAAWRDDFGRVPESLTPLGIDMEDFPVLRWLSIACCFLLAFASSGSSPKLASSSSSGSSSALD